MRVPLPALLLAASTALAADPRIVGPPEQTPAPQPAPSPAPGPRPAIPQPAEPPSPIQAQPGAGTEKQPLVVRVLPTQKTAEEVEAEKAERDERVAAERSLTNYTRYLWLATCALAFVAFAQAGLFVWQLVLLRRSVRDTETAANAAAASAEAARSEANAAQRMLVLTQRPKLRVRNVVVKYPVPNHRPPFGMFEAGQPISGQFYVANIGGTVARIVVGDCRVYWTQQGLPMERPYEGQVIENPMPPIKLEAGQSTLIPFHSRQAMGPEGDDIRTFAAGWRLYVMGWIEYSDDLNNPRRTTFCREYRQVLHSSLGHFLPVDDPDYEHEE